MREFYFINFFYSQSVQNFFIVQIELKIGNKEDYEEKMFVNLTKISAYSTANALLKFSKPYRS